jgi:asparagine synthase (glutamine-hydrolysing)
VCGIAGIISKNKNEVTQQRLTAMAAAMAHRGPDGEGVFINKTENIGLAHRRLAILDLSGAATQPLHYLNRYTIIHNGELYNYIEIKDQLIKKGYSFKTQTDTEVIVAAYAAYGEACLQEFDGMFAFAVWDEQEQLLFAARDRFGEKPFYYYFDEDQFCFASELKGLWAIGIPKEMNHSMLCLYLGLGYTSIPLQPEITFYKNIFSLPPSHFLKMGLYGEIEIQNYWDIDKETQIVISENDAIEKFTELFTTSLKRRLRSDVTIGTSLSGGLDSSSIVAFLKQLNITQYSTFSAVFPGYSQDESMYINKVKENFQIQNFQTTPTAQNFEDDFHKLLMTQEMPFNSASVYAQYKVFELAKQQNVTVLIDGQGADETIGGYTKYIHWYLQELWQQDKAAFAEAKKALLTNNVPFSWGVKNIFATWFPAPATNQLEKKAVNQLKWHNYLNQDYIEANFSRLFIHKPLVKKLNDMLYYNTMQFGLEELLRYADKNAMAHGVEVRLPFLNHELVQFVFSLPTQYKIKEGFQKYILRKSVDKILPYEITWRKDKVGYEPPQEQWLQYAKLIEKINTCKLQLLNNGMVTKAILNKQTTSSQNWRVIMAAAYL